jgi:hypothetical protein
VPREGATRRAGHQTLSAELPLARQDIAQRDKLLSLLSVAIHPGSTFANAAQED